MFASLSEYLAGWCNQGGHIYNREASRNFTAIEDIDRADDTGQGSSTYQQLPTVELVRLLTDVSGLVREKSQFTQYINYCYRLSKESKPILMEILSND